MNEIQPDNGINITKDIQNSIDQVDEEDLTLSNSNPSSSSQINPNQILNVKKDKFIINNPPSIQNLNQLILGCVKNDEYCTSFIDYLKKMIYIKQIDYYLAYANILYCFKPKEIIETAKIRKHLKNKYARDDPGFLLVLILNLFFSSIAYSFSFKHYNPFFILNVFFVKTFVILFTFGLIIALVSKTVVDKFFKNDEIGTKEQSVEFAYAFDIHCNSFVPLYFFCGFLPFLFLPLVNYYNYLINIVFSNTCCCIGVLYYGYVTFMGYFSLPFVRKYKYVTLAIWPIILTFLIATLLKMNVIHLILYLFYAE